MNRRQHTPHRTLQLTAAGALLALAGAVEATAMFEARSALFVTFAGASAGVSGTDYSVGAAQPFAPTLVTSGTGSGSTDDDVFPGGYPGWDIVQTETVTGRVNVQGLAEAPRQMPTPTTLLLLLSALAPAVLQHRAKRHRLLAHAPQG